MTRENAYRYTIQVRAALEDIKRSWSDAPEIQRNIDTALRATARVKKAMEKREGRQVRPGKQYAPRPRKRR
jgi:hypothetical protein